MWICEFLFIFFLFFIFFFASTGIWSPDPWRCWQTNMPTRPRRPTCEFLFLCFHYLALKYWPKFILSIPDFELLRFSSRWQNLIYSITNLQWGQIKLSIGFAVLNWPHFRVIFEFGGKSGIFWQKSGVSFQKLSGSVANWSYTRPDLTNLVFWKGVWSPKILVGLLYFFWSFNYKSKKKTLKP